MSDIPSELFREILSRVPARALLRFRCVCKVWHDMIDDPDFIKSHIDRQLLKIQDFSNGVGHLIIGNDKIGRGVIPLDSLDPNGIKNIEALPFYNNPWEQYNEQISFVSSCNGVMLLTLDEGKSHLWNPLTRESHELPAHSTVMDQEPQYVFRGFGYDYADDDYKVVKIAQLYDSNDSVLESEAMVYSLKLDSWRRIKDFPYFISSMNHDVFLNGAVHWIAIKVPETWTNHFIAAIDLRTEDYLQLPLPPALSGEPERVPLMNLNMLGGCLALSCLYWLPIGFDLWLMNDYGVKNSWTKLFSIAGLDRQISKSLCPEWPISYSESKGQLLLMDNKRRLLLFDLEKKSAKTIVIDCKIATFSSTLHLESLVRLNVGGSVGGSIGAKGI